MFIAVPTGVKILNWTATMWGGKLNFSAPMLFSIGLVTMFTIGGLSGVMHSVAPMDTQQTHVLVGQIRNRLLENECVVGSVHPTLQPTPSDVPPQGCDYTTEG
jgi:heme/copper-type cytochrome/quinol oxidase subunit 1